MLLLEKKSKKVIQVNSIGIGTRISIDFIDELEPDEYLLVGNISKGFVGVLSESRQTETYPPRKFRVNAGAIHQYIYMGENRTKYLSEICPGDEVYVSSVRGERYVSVGRIKKEKREMIRLVFKDEDCVSATLQKSDSVYLCSNECKCILDITPGDLVDVFKSEIKATHKGKAIEEYLVEE